MADGLGTVDQIDRQASRCWVFGDVLVKLAVFCAAIEAAVVFGEHRLVVVAFDDEIGLVAVIQHDVQIFTHAFAANILRANIFSGRIFKVVSRTLDRFDARGVALVAAARRDIKYFVCFFVACIDEDADSFSHDMNLLICYLDRRGLRINAP